MSYLPYRDNPDLAGIFETVQTELGQLAEQIDQSSARGQHADACGCTDPGCEILLGRSLACHQASSVEVLGWLHARGLLVFKVPAPAPTDHSGLSAEHVELVRKAVALAAEYETSDDIIVPDRDQIYAEAEGAWIGTRLMYQAYTVDERREICTAIVDHTAAVLLMNGWTPPALPTPMVWQKITCTQREALVNRLGRSYNGFSRESGIGVISSCTDPDGDFGKPEIFTEWGYDEDRPVLRDHRFPDTGRPCEHYEYVAASACESPS